MFSRRNFINARFLAAEVRWDNVADFFLVVMAVLDVVVPTPNGLLHMTILGRCLGQIYTTFSILMHFGLWADLIRSSQCSHDFGWLREFRTSNLVHGTACS